MGRKRRLVYTIHMFLLFLVVLGWTRGRPLRNDSCPDGLIDLIGNGDCDFQNNNEECGYDGGDCCECTCIDNENNPCEFSGYKCLDPKANCSEYHYSNLDLPNCSGDLKTIGDGECDADYNNKDCEYDRGDCCFCTCERKGCAISDFHCLDPNATAEVYSCEASPPTPEHCLPDLQREWRVENRSQAYSLAETVNCSRGTFHVEWRGNITIDKPIFVAHETVLNITGIGSNSVIDGGGKTRLFTVVNASLHISGVNMSNGNANSGGAIAASNSTLKFGRVMFIGNNVYANGGALFLTENSTVSFGDDTVFFNNSAQMNGGAMYVSHGSSSSWSSETTFLSNTAQARGGALLVSDYSNASWTARMIFSGNTAVRDDGGGLCLLHSSTAAWSGETTFVDNKGDKGGGLRLIDGSHVFWSGKTMFSRNTAQEFGGGICISGASTILWTEETTFSGNFAGEHGGGLFTKFNSNVSWSAPTNFSGNTALVWGGAVFTGSECKTSWSADTIFISNSADNDGGAMHTQNGFVTWDANYSLFFNNTADYGGALVVMDGSTVEWMGETHFTSNVATFDGGAVASKVSYTITPSITTSRTFSDNDEESQIIIAGKTIFDRNSCGVHGGGIAILETVFVSFHATDITFRNNSAAVAGGAVFISGADIGPVFTGTRLVSNSAQVGGAVYATGSGTTETASKRGDPTENPTTFNGCTFEGNSADATGGAIDSASGQDRFVNTSFVRNSAGVGGALRLAGTTSVENCSFVENSSGDGGGPVVSNIGVISKITRSSFRDNVFYCDPGEFLSFNKSGDIFETVCNGCGETCHECQFEGRQALPICISLEEAGVKHGTSHGGFTTVEELLIEEGYWRTTTTSTNILKCYNSMACPGGITSGFCKPGYEGPYCAVCSKGYVKGPNFTCTKCSENTSGIAIAAVFGVVGLIIFMMIFSFLLSGEIEGSSRRFVETITRFIPLQTLKIVIVAWQILTQFVSVANVTYPDLYQRFLYTVDLLNFDFSWVLSTGCLVRANFHDRLLIVTIGPIVCLGLLLATYIIACYLNRGSEAAIRNIRRKHVSALLLVTFFVYSSVSSNLFQMFSCESFDNGKVYLRADYSIECDSRGHKALQLYAGFMILVYPVGIPALYAGLLFRKSNILLDENRREDALTVQSTSDLWKPYKPNRYYYEVVECMRRALLAGVLLVIKDDTAAQIAVTLMIAFAFAIVFEILSPYESRLDTWMSRAGHAVVYMSMYFALLLKVDVSKETQSSQNAFEYVLMATHACMVLTAVVEAAMMTCSLRENNRSGIMPKKRQQQSLNSNEDSSEVLSDVSL